MPLSSFYSLIGKPVIEKYGRFKGRVVGFETDEDGNLKSIIFENGGVILSKSSQSFDFHDGYLIYMPIILKEGRSLLDEYSDLELYLETLKKMVKLGLNINVIRLYYSKLESKFYSLERRYKSYIKNVNNRKKRIEDRIEWLRSIIFYLHMGNDNGYLNSTIYKFSYDTLSTEILRYTSELEDLEEISLKLATIHDKIESHLNEFSKEVSKYEVGEEA